MDFLVYNNIFGVNSFLQGLFGQNKIPQHLFALSPYKATFSYYGELHLGGIKREQFTGDIHYVPIIGNKWQVKLDGL